MQYELTDKHLMKLIEFLNGSAVSAPFRASLEAFLATGRASERIAFPPHAPTIKVERTLTKVLQAYPEMPIESVRIDGHSGCEFFRGEVVVRSALEGRRIAFEWDCRWKAMELGWIDYFGFPDQTRAAREFGHDCFRSWDEEAIEVLAEV